MPKADTLKWLEKARDDEKTIGAVIPFKLWNIACYHAQQAAEKYIKAAIVEATLVPDRTHDLVDLLGTHPSYVYEQALNDAADRLTPMASSSRYPGFSNFTEPETMQAQEDLARVKAWAMSQIP